MRIFRVNKSIYNFIYNNGILLFVSLLVLISGLNIYPDGYIYSSGDFSQMVNFSDKIHWFSNTFIDYGEGSVNHNFVPLYQYIFNFIQNIAGVQFVSFFYSFIFLGLSFASFYIAAKKFRTSNELNKFSLACYSFIYAVNAYTCFNRFNLPNVFFSLYILVPILFVFSHNYFLNKTIFNRTLLACCFIFLVANPVWFNPSYFVAFSILIFLYIVVYYIVSQPYSLSTFIRKNIAFGFVFISSSLISILPVAPILYGYTSTFANNQGQMLKWIASQAIPMNKVFALGERYYHNLNLFSIVGIDLIPFSIFILFIYVILNTKRNINTYIFSIVIMFLIILMNKGNGLFGQHFFYYLFDSNPILASLRSYDKTLIFLPFFLLIVVTFNENIFNNNKLALSFTLITIICLYPLLNGNYYKFHYRTIDNGSDYKSSRFAPYVKIPEGYFNISSILNKSDFDYKIFSVPWSLFNPALKGWVVFPKWKLIGVNPLTQFFVAPVVQMNSYSAFGDWNYGKYWNKQNNIDSEWILPFAGILNAKYLIYHKDINPTNISETISKINYYNNNGFIKKVYSDNFFDFYKIDDNFFIPHLYVPKKLVYIDNVDYIPEYLSKKIQSSFVFLFFKNKKSIKKNSPLVFEKPFVEYRKINSSKYVVKFHKVRESFPFVFSETFNPLWKIYLKKYNSNTDIDLRNYNEIPGDNYSQVSRHKLKEFLKSGIVTDLGQGIGRKHDRKIWSSLNRSTIYEKKFTIDFISKLMKGTIQNNNIPTGSAFDTLFLSPLDLDHEIANGYSNFWRFDLKHLTDVYPEYLNANDDGTYDFEVIIEFWPQKLLCISKIYTAIYISLILLLYFLGVFKKKFWGRSSSADLTTLSSSG